MERYGNNDYELYASKNVRDDSWIKAVFCFVSEFVFLLRMVLFSFTVFLWLGGAVLNRLSTRTVYKRFKPIINAMIHLSTL